jgi:hypothetical protein
VTERILHGKFVGGAVFYSGGVKHVNTEELRDILILIIFMLGTVLFDRYFKLSVNILKKKYEEVGRPKAT